LASQLADKENYCGLLVEEGEVYKQSLLKMNEEGMKLEREIQDKENLVRTYEKFNDENRYMHSSSDDEKDLLRRRYNELKDESEKLVQVNSMIRADLDDFREKYRELESQAKNNELDGSYAKKEGNQLRYEIKNKDEEIRLLQADRQEVFYLRAEKLRLEEQIKYLTDMTSTLQNNQFKTMEEKIQIGSREQSLKDEMYRQINASESMRKDLEEMRKSREEFNLDAEKLKGELALWKRKCEEQEQHYYLAEKKASEAEKVTDSYKKAGKEGVELVMRDKEALRAERDQLYQKHQDVCQELVTLRDNYNLVLKNVNEKKLGDLNYNEALEDKEKLIYELQKDRQNLIDNLTKKDIENNGIRDCFDMDKQALQNLIYELKEDNEQMRMKSAEIEALQSCIEEERTHHRMEMKKMRNETEDFKKKYSFFFLKWKGARLMRKMKVCISKNWGRRTRART
jgi:myosin heavy subunit